MSQDLPVLLAPSNPMPFNRLGFITPVMRSRLAASLASINAFCINLKLEVVVIRLIKTVGRGCLNYRIRTLIDCV